MMKYKAIVFDWDGTLANSVEAITKCKGVLATEFDQIAPDIQMVKSVLGMPFDQAMRVCFPLLDESKLIIMKQRFHVLMCLEEYQATIFHGTLNLLNTLKSQNIKLAIATAKATEELKIALLHNKITNIFDIVCCAENYKEKPNPLMLNHILQTFNLDANSCLMVGDTDSDIIFAENAQMKAIGVTFGSQKIHNRDNLLCLVDSWEQLLQAINLGE